LKNRLFSENDFIDAFIGELKPGLRAFVKAFKPTILEDAYDHACNLEGAVEIQNRKFKFTHKTTPTIPASKPYVPPSSSKGTLIEQRRALGLCFKCGDKYYSSHQCKIKIQILLDQEDNGIEVMSEEEAPPVSDPELLAKEVVVSMHATHPNSFMQTMRFKGKISNSFIYALLDSGSTHSFINPSVLQGQNLSIQVTKPLIVMVANGQRMVTYSQYASLNFSLQGKAFTGNLRLLQI
jgi:Retroviral aspartyl protease